MSTMAAAAARFRPLHQTTRLALRSHNHTAIRQNVLVPYRFASNMANMSLTTLDVRPPHLDQLHDDG